MAYMPGQFGSSSKLVLVLFFAGAAAVLPALAQKQNGTPSTAPAVQPGFTVKLTYFQKAMDTLVARKGTVIVVGYLYGFPNLGSPTRVMNGEEKGTVGLGQLNQEVMPGADATFSKIKLDVTALRYIDRRGPQLLINVVSGRKSSPNNLLGCGIYAGPLQDAQGKTLPITCKLIGE
jgi:hypothetical protein